MGKIESTYAYSFYRGEHCKDCGKLIPVFGLGHQSYDPGGPFTELMGDNKDVQSQKENKFYLYGNKECEAYFLRRFKTLYSERFDGGEIVFDYVCVAPSGKVGKYNQNMLNLVKQFGTAVNIPVKTELLKRTKDTNSQHKLKHKEERSANVKDTIIVDEDIIIKDKTILVFDNTIISGATVKEIFHKLKERDAKAVIFFCIGLGAKAKEIDFDLNPFMRDRYANQIMQKFHWPKVSQELRKKYAGLKNQELENAILTDLIDNTE